MKKATILFFQELYQNSIAQERILSFCKNTQLKEMEENASFLNHIFIGDETADIRDKYEALKKRAAIVSEPEEILSVQTDFIELVNFANRYMFSTMQMLKKDIFMPQEIRMLHPLFEKYALGKVNKMTSKVLYCLICRNGLETEKILDFCIRKQNIDSRKIIRSVSFLNELVELIRERKVYRWKYVQKQIYFDKLGKMPQFMISNCLASEAEMIPGKPVVMFENIKDSSDTELVIEGKGYLTNMNPQTNDLYELLTGDPPVFSDDELRLNRNIIWKLDFSGNPVDVLNDYFQGSPFVISALAYFRFANTCMLFQRVRLIFGD